MKENTKLPLILILALPILLIVSTEVAHLSFNLFGQTIYISTLIFPITLFISVLITKMKESKTAMTIVILTLIIQCLVFVLKWVFFGTADYALMEITFLAFFISQLVILLGYEVLKELKKTQKYFYVLIIFLFATLIETMFYIGTYTNITIMSFVINVVIKVVYDLVMAKIIAK